MNTILSISTKLNWGIEKFYQWYLTSKLRKLMQRFQTIHDKVNSRDGNSREHRIRSQNND